MSKTAAKPATTAATETISEKSGGKRKLLLIGGGVAVVVLLAIMWLLGVLPIGHKQAAPAKLGTRSAPVYVETPEMVTNLDAGPHRMSFAKLQLKIELGQASDQASVTAAMPRIVDMIQTYVRELRPEELRSETATFKLHEALLDRASIVVPNAAVTDILFEELVVQ